MTKKLATLVGTVGAIAIIAAMTIAPAASARSLAPCDASGAYTDRLCPGDGLGAGQYILSADANTRFYYGSDGNAHVSKYDFATEQWVPFHSVFGPHSDPGEFVYSDPGNAGNSYYSVWDGFDQVAFTSDQVAASGQHYLTVTNSGCVAAFDEAGTLLWSSAPAETSCSLSQ